MERKGKRQEEGPKGRAEKYNKFKNLLRLIIYNYVSICIYIPIIVL